MPKAHTSDFIASLRRDGGETGALIADHDWSTTSLGLIEAWPQSLRSALGILLRSPIPIVMLWNEDGVMLYNDAYSVFAGGRHPRLLGSKVREGWPEVAAFNDNVMKVGLSGRTLAYKDQELTLYRHGVPERVWMNLDYSPVPDESGAPAGVIAIVVETTQRVLAERKVQSERDRQQYMLQQMPGFAAVLNGPEHIHTYVNDAYVDISDGRPLVGRTVRDAFRELENQGVYELLDGVYTTGEPFVARTLPVRLAGHDHDTFLDFVFQPLRDGNGAIEGIFVGGYDVTDVHLEEVRRAALPKLNDRIRDLDDPDAIADAASEILATTLNVSRAGYGIIDSEAETITIRSDWNAPGIRSLAGVLNFRDYGSYIEDLKRGETVVFADADKDPRTRETAAALKAINAQSVINMPVTEHGRFVALLYLNHATAREWPEDELAFIREVADRTRTATERARASDALRRNERRLRLLSDVEDATRSLQDAREVMEVTTRLLGRHLNVSRCAYADMEPDDDHFTIRADWCAPGVASTVGYYSLALFGSKAVRDLRQGETLILRDIGAELSEDDGRAMFHAIDINAIVTCPLVKEGRLRALMAIHDIKAHDWSAEEIGLAQSVVERCWAHIERVRSEAQLREINESLEATVEVRTQALIHAEDQLRQAQKMEAVGQLTGGIAHDFNNMLAVVMGSLELLGRRIGDQDARARHHVEAARDAARRAANLTQRLLAFSRQQPLRPEWIDVNRLVTGMSDLLRGAIGSDIRLETVLAAGLWRIHADPNQLESVILNLGVNARDAMPGGGRLTIETQNTHIDARYSATHVGVPQGQYVMIAITDTGEGMSPDVVAKAFDPFFTTKAVGKGTGLGLSQVYGFVKQSGGHVKIYSELGQGTTVKIYLPRSATEAQTEDDPWRGEAYIAESQMETILVVDDEPAVRQFSADALTELGYRVVEADSGATALRLLEAHPEIVMLFTDIVMPDMNGRALADAARAVRPDLKVLYTTGYTRNAVVHNGILDRGVELIGKPYTIDELAVRVRGILDS